MNENDKKSDCGPYMTILVLWSVLFSHPTLLLSFLARLSNANSANSNLTNGLRAGLCGITSVGDSSHESAVHRWLTSVISIGAVREQSAWGGHSTSANLLGCSLPHFADALADIYSGFKTALTACVAHDEHDCIHLGYVTQAKRTAWTALIPVLLFVQWRQYY